MTVGITSATKKLGDMPTERRPLKVVVARVLTAGVDEPNKNQDAAQGELLAGVGLDPRIKISLFSLNGERHASSKKSI